MNAKLNIAILGTGNIGTDLLIKVLRSQMLRCAYFVGRSENSPGMLKAKSLGINVSSAGVQVLLDHPETYDLVFDATSANDHLVHGPKLMKLGKFLVDLTPAKLGELICPIVNLDAVSKFQNVNMITCGGQASTPLAHALGQTQTGIEYIEVVSSIASLSAGPATRRNMDEYIETTEKALTKFSGCDNTKAILILNPADPCINMQTTISAKLKNPDLDQLDILLEKIIKQVNLYVPGYKLVVPPVYENGRIMMMVRVTGRGDFLPTYAGNLDIINCSAIKVAEEYAILFHKQNFAMAVG